MRADSKAAEGALQSTVHLPEQLFLLFRVVSEQREMLLRKFLRSMSTLIPSPKPFPCSHAAFPDVIPKMGPVLCSGSALC